MSLWRRLMAKKKLKKAVNLPEGLDIGQRQEKLDHSLSFDLITNLNAIRELYGNSCDVTIHKFIAGPGKIPGAIVSIEGMVQEQSLREMQRIVLIDSLKLNIKAATDPLPFYQLLKDSLLTNYDLMEVSNLDKLCEHLSSGHKVLLINGVDRALDCSTQGFETRALEEPTNEAAIRGPKVGFIEDIRVNTSLIRRRLKTPNLWIESFTIGNLSRTKVNIAYIKGLTSDELVAEVRLRLQRIDIDAILESGYIEEFIEDTPFTLFPLLIRTERPDLISAGLVEGRVAIFTDGTPFVLLAPVNLWDMLQAPDDYYEKASIASFIRNLRIFTYWMSMLVPGIYVAIVNFHHELLPSGLTLRIASTREGVPFPVVAEVLLFEFVFEMLREAGIRLPQAVGSAISIVGAVILGEAAVQAGLASPAVVIVIALTAISSFTVPVFDLGISGRLLVFLFIALGATVGLFGIQLGILLLLIHLCSLRSFGTPYFVPIGPMVLGDWRDVFVRTWWWDMIQRPKLMGIRKLQRQNKGQMPRPEPRHKDVDEDEDTQDF